MIAQLKTQQTELRGVFSFAYNMFFYGFETRGRAQGARIRPLALPRGPIPLDPNAF